LLDLDIWIFLIEMMCCPGLVFAIGMIPIHDFNALVKCRILLLGENRNRLNTLLLGLVVCVFRAFGRSVWAITLGEYSTHTFAFFQLDC